VIQLIAFIIFLVSFLGIVFVLYKKAPALARLPQRGHHGFKKSRFIMRIEKKIQDVHFRIFSKQVWLHKLLSWVKVWTLKVETRIDTLLHRIRKKAQQLDREVKKKR